MRLMPDTQCDHPFERIQVKDWLRVTSDKPVTPSVIAKDRLLPTSGLRSSQ
jgi:hypothetical protein